MNTMFKKIVSVLCILALCMSFTGVVNASAESELPSWEVSDESGYTATGDFSSLTNGYLIFYPSDIRETEESYPLLVWANGTMCPPGLYYNLLGSVAREGYIVVTNTDMMTADGTSQIGMIDYALNLNSNPESLIYGRVDENRIGAFGHSQGGRSTVNAAIADSRIKAAVSLAGSNTKNEVHDLTTPTLFFTGTLDTVVMSSLWVKPAYNKAEGPAVYASLNGGIHTTCCFEPSCYTDEIVKWFRAWLDGDTDAKGYFKAGGAMSTDKDWKNYTCKGF